MARDQASHDDRCCRRRWSWHRYRYRQRSGATPFGGSARSLPARPLGGHFTRPGLLAGAGRDQELVCSRSNSARLMQPSSAFAYSDPGLVELAFQRLAGNCRGCWGLSPVHFEGFPA